MQWTCTAQEGGLVLAGDSESGCFVLTQDGRCRTRRQCQSRVRKERRALLARLDAVAEDGNPIFAAVARELPLPVEVWAADRADQPVAD